MRKTARPSTDLAGARRCAPARVVLDVTDRDALKPAIDEVERTLGPIDILVNNAGIALTGGALRGTVEDWDRVIETNLQLVLHPLAA